MSGWSRDGARARASVESLQVGTQRVYRLTQDGEALGTLAIDSTVAGRARGGLRMLPDVSEEEICSAARAMTLKYGFLGLPQGGAKAGLRADPEGQPETKRERLLQFARALEPLLRERRFVPDADMGTRASDIRWMLETIGIPVSRREWRSNRSGHYTAVSCVAAARAALARCGAALAGCRAAIEGFGSVGSAAADLLGRQGAVIVAVSTSQGALYNSRGLDLERLLQLASEVGSRCVERYPAAERLDRAELLELPVDLLCPCARYHSIHAGNAARIAARVVCAGANDPVRPEAERMLLERGMVYPPDFISNCGGVLGGTLEFAGVRFDRITALIQRHVEAAVDRLLVRAHELGVPPRAIAERLALARHRDIALSCERPSFRARLMGLGMECYRRGLLPQALVGSLAPAYIERRLHGWNDT